MSRKPEKVALPAHPRLQEFSGRVARLHEGDTAVGWLLVRSNVYREREGGALWWRRWTPWMHAAELLVHLPARGPGFTDLPVMPDALDEEIQDWKHNRFRLYGATYQLVWLDRRESQRMAETIFGGH